MTLEQKVATDLELYFKLARGFSPALHQRAVIKLLQRFLIACWQTPPSKAEAFRVLNINMPPGSAKSTIVSSTLPAWVLGSRPFERIGIVSAKGDLVQLFETVIKKEISEGEVYTTVYTDEDNRPDYSRGWATGRLYVKGLPAGEITPSIAASGLYGSILGKRYTMIILDDAQDQEGARTPGQRDKTWQFINDTVLSRAVPGSPIINAQQRLHYDDISSRLERLYDAQTFLLPALDDEGNSYWPDMYPAAWLEQRQRAEPHTFAAWYQQKPLQSSAEIFKPHWFQYKHADARDTLYQSWDTAVKTGQGNDYTACIEGRVDRNSNVYVTDIYRKKLEFPQLIEQVERFGRRRPHIALVEDKASGSPAIQTLKQSSSLPIVGVVPKGDKEERARSVTGWFESGKVFFPPNHPMLAELEHELLSFPDGLNDDMVDALTQLLNYVIGGQTQVFGGPVVSQDEELT